MSAEHGPKHKGKHVEKFRKATGELIRMVGLITIVAAAAVAYPSIAFAGGAAYVGGSILEGKNKKSSVGH